MYKFDQALPVGAFVVSFFFSRIRGYHIAAAKAAGVLHAVSIAHDAWAIRHFDAALFERLVEFLAP